MKRLMDIVIAGVAIVILSIPLIVLAVLVQCTSAGPALYWSERIGRNNQPFNFPKFRTMYVDTPLVATDKLVNPDAHITRLGRFLRRSSLDELPQLFLVLSGKMSLVGPRPVLVSQARLLKMRNDAGIHTLKPGITGWAQINGRDDLGEDAKVQLDAEYKEMQSIFFDIQIMWRTIFYVLKSNGVWH